MGDFTEAKPDVAADPLRAEIEAIKASGVSLADIAREAGVPYGTFTLWRTGKYAGDNGRIDEKMRQFLETRAARQRARLVLPRAPGFIETRTAEAFVAALEYAQMACDIAVITGAAGVGKTVACKHYAATRSNVWMMTAEPLMAGANRMMAELAEVIGLAAAPSPKRARGVVARLRDTGGLIIVDEAQHLASAALDQLRSVHDKAGVGLAIVGNHAVHQRLESDGRGHQLAQIFSRVGMRILRNAPLGADIDGLLDAWKVDGAEERRLLRTIARRPGALRGMTKALRVAHMLAGGEPIQASHITTAWSRVSQQQLEGDVA